MIDITLIGTGALMPIPDRALASVMLRCEGKTILFDCGEGTQSAARKAQVSLINTDVIALTHYHGDHVFGLPGLLQTMQCMDRVIPLTVIGPRGIGNALEPILALAGETSFEIRLVEAHDTPIVLSDIVDGFNPLAVLTPFRVNHFVTACGYSFTLGRMGKFNPEKAESLNVPVEKWSLLQKGESVTVGDSVIMPEQVMGDRRKGLKFVISGDTAECDSLSENAADADLFVCEATLGENEQQLLANERGHMTFASAAKTAGKAGVKKLCLTHFSPRVVDSADYIENATAIFENTVCGADGMRFTLDFEE